jgi:hypothetical protein
MQAVIDKVIETYAMMHSLTQTEIEEARGLLSDFLFQRSEAVRSETDEHQATIDGLKFLRNLKN